MKVEVTLTESLRPPTNGQVGKLYLLRDVPVLRVWDNWVSLRDPGTIWKATAFRVGIDVHEMPAGSVVVLTQE